MTRVISIIDDDSAILDSVALLLEANGLRAAPYDSAATFLGSKEASDCIISDVRMPGLSGLELLGKLKDASDSRPLILLTGHGDIEMAVHAIKIGAFDFIEKPFQPSRLLEAIASAINASAKTRAVQEQVGVWHDRYQSLTERQTETMTLLVQGMANKEIAARLGISPRTVEIHRTWVMNKMEARTLADLVRIGIALKVA